jgi:hypothetical protein
MLVDDPEVLALKLVNGKVSFVHADVWPLLLRIVEDLDWKQRAVRTLDRASLTLLDQVEHAGTLRLDRLAESWSSGTAALKKSRTALEKRGLVVSRDVHTEAGTHAQVLESWRHFREATGARPDINTSLGQAVHELKRIASGNRLTLEVA